VNHIETYLPHRPPFLFVDDAHIEGETIIATHTFHDDDWFFKGHFPSFPIVPGVLLVESMAQAGGVGAKLMGIYPQKPLHVREDQGSAIQATGPARRHAQNGNIECPRFFCFSASERGRQGW